MAKTLEDLLIKLGVDGIEEVKQLKGSLRQLQQTAKLSDESIEKLAKGIKNYTRVVGTSEKAIRGQIAALKGAREQAQIGGKAYNDLSRDIERYEKRLKSVGNTSEETGKKVLSAAQILAQFPARKPSAFSVQINQLNKDLADLKVNTDAYVLQLRKIQEREDSFRQAQARQSVIARAQTAAGGVVDPRAAITISTALPKTTAALSLRVSELKENLQNLDFTSNQYRDTQREILSIEKQLADATNQRIEAIKGVTDQQRRAERLAERSRGRKQRLLANQASADAEYNAALGAHIAAPAMPTRELSNLYQSIGRISSAGMAREIEMMGNSYRKVAADINLAARAGGNSIASLQGQRVAFDNLRNVLDPTSLEFRQVSRQIQTLDARLGKLTQTSNRFSKANLLQGAGAIASAGIFGGPLGALGAGAGFAVGGPGGAVLGAGVGAVAESIRQQLSELAEYATQLNLAKQTLALAADGQEEYNNLLKTARNISQDYAISLKETIGGFSQVAVAARANNLTLEETETIFRGLVSAGIAFGKSQQDIDAIVRATVQVLSKGKLSAEELQGQIGERLPGAVARFAEATGRSLPQLADDLKAGTVQISDFVDFSRKNFLDYDKVAQLIADGPEKAGARLKLALDESVENFGGFFLTVGAGFQDLFRGIVNFANDNVDVIKNMVADFIIAAEKIELVFKDLAVDIQNALGPVLGGIVGLFNRGVDTVYQGVMRERELQAGGFDGEQALRNAREAARNVVGPLGPLDPRYAKAEQEAYAVELKSALLAGRKVLEELGRGRVDESEERRKEILDSLKFKPFAFGDYKTGQKLPGLSVQDPDAEAGISAKQVELAQRLAQAEGEVAADVQATLKYMLARQKILDKNLDSSEEQVRLAEALRRFRGDIANIGKREAAEAERQADADARKYDKIQQARVLAGEITQEEYDRVRTLEEMKVLLEDMPDLYNKIKEKLEEAATPLGKFRDGVKKIFEEAMNLNEALATAGVQAVQQFGDAFADFVATGKASFADLTRSILQDLSRIFARAALFQSLSLIPGVGGFLGLGGGGGGGGSTGLNVEGIAAYMNAKGNIYAKNKIVPFAYGGIVNKPTLFPMANGAGLMGEAGPEAIMPLRRGRDGKLGVEASGGVGNVVVNVDASGSRVQGDQPNAKALGSAIGAAVQAEIVRQKRPGGLLS